MAGCLLGIGKEKTRQEQNTNQYLNKLSCHSSAITLAAERRWKPGLDLGSPAFGREEALASVSPVWKDVRRGCPLGELYTKDLNLVARGMCFVLCMQLVLM